MDFKSAFLSGGSFQIIPESTVILNPEEEGRRSYLYLVWLFDVEHPDDNHCIADTLEGRGVLDHLFGFFTDYWDLYKTGRHDAAMLKSRFELVGPDFLKLFYLMLDAVKRELPPGSPWAFAYCLCDHLGREVPVGYTDAFYPRRSADD